MGFVPGGYREELIAKGEDLYKMVNDKMEDIKSGKVDKVTRLFVDNCVCKLTALEMLYYYPEMDSNYLVMMSKCRKMIKILSKMAVGKSTIRPDEYTVPEKDPD